MTPREPSPGGSPFSWIGDLSTELAARRTTMSFQRTRMAADRTLMAVIRTALSLIGFGFTIFQFLQRLAEGNLIAPGTSGRDFGIALVSTGVVMLLLGIAYHVQFMWVLRRERRLLAEEGLIHEGPGFPPSLTLITAVILLGLGLLAILGMVFGIGPLG